MEWIITNKDWIFSGAGVFIISLIIGLFSKKAISRKQIQKSGKNSTNYQAGENITIGKDND